MQFVQQYGKELVSLLVPFITWVLNVGMRAKVRLLWGMAHGFNFIVNEPLRDQQGTVVSPTQIARTRSLRILNIGRETATDVELVFNWKPMCINVWPVRDYQEKAGPDNRYILVFPTVAPKEEIQIEVLMVNVDMPELINVRCKQSVGERIDMHWIRGLPRWRIRAAVLSMFVGFGTIIYWLIVAVQFLVLRTPTTS